MLRNASLIYCSSKPLNIDYLKAQCGSAHIPFNQTIKYVLRREDLSAFKVSLYVSLSLMIGVLIDAIADDRFRETFIFMFPVCELQGGLASI